MTAAPPRSIDLRPKAVDRDLDATDHDDDRGHWLDAVGADWRKAMVVKSRRCRERLCLLAPEAASTVQELFEDRVIERGESLPIFEGLWRPD
jgi:hypothetical protein